MVTNKFELPVGSRLDADGKTVECVKSEHGKCMSLDGKTCFFRKIYRTPSPCGFCSPEQRRTIDNEEVCYLEVEK